MLLMTGFLLWVFHCRSMAVLLLNFLGSAKFGSCWLRFLVFRAIYVILLGFHAGLCVCEDKGVVAVDNQPISQLWRYSIELVVPVFSHR